MAFPAYVPICITYLGAPWLQPLPRQLAKMALVSLRPQHQLLANTGLSHRRGVALVDHVWYRFIALFENTTTQCVLITVIKVAGGDD